MDKLDKQEQKNGERQILFIIILSIITLIIAIIGATFAFFAARIIGNDDASSVLIKSNSLTIEYKNKNEINETDIKPGFSKTINFTISNKENAPAGYKIYWLVSKNEFVNDDFVYTLTATNPGTGGTVVTANNAVMPKKTTSIGTGVIPKNTVQTYTLNIKFIETGVNQDENQNKTFIGKIEVRNK